MWSNLQMITDISIIFNSYVHDVLVRGPDSQIELFLAQIGGQERLLVARRSGGEVNHPRSRIQPEDVATLAE